MSPDPAFCRQSRAACVGGAVGCVAGAAAFVLSGWWPLSLVLVAVGAGHLWMAHLWGRSASEWRKDYEDDGLVAACLTPGQVVLPPGSDLTDEQVRAVNGADTEIIRLP